MASCTPSVKFFLFPQESLRRAGSSPQPFLILGISDREGAHVTELSGYIRLRFYFFLGAETIIFGMLRMKARSNTPW
jgi:hypothetical protein